VGKYEILHFVQDDRNGRLKMTEKQVRLRVKVDIRKDRNG